MYLAVRMGIFPPSTEMLASYIMLRSSSLRVYKTEEKGRIAVYRWQSGFLYDQIAGYIESYSSDVEN